MLKICGEISKYCVLFILLILLRVVLVHLETIYIFCYETHHHHQPQSHISQRLWRLTVVASGGWGGVGCRSKYIWDKMDLINLSENVGMTKNLCARMSRMIEVGSNIEY